MEKILYNGLEEGGVYQMRTGEFVPIHNFEQVISDFDNMYESYQNSPTLFTVHGNDEIKVIADTHKLRLNVEGIDFEYYDNLDKKLEQLKSHLKNNKISDLSSEIICEMIENEDFTVSAIIERIAQPNQIIKIECTDTLYGNGEYNLTL